MGSLRHISHTLRLCILLLGGASLWQSARAQQGFLRTYHEELDYAIYGLRILQGGDIMVSGQLGNWVQHPRDMRLDRSGNVVWRNDTTVAGIEYEWRDLSLGDSLFFEAGMASWDPMTMSDPYIRCYDAQGKNRWARTYGVYQRDQFVDLAVSRFGEVYAMGPFEDTTFLHATFVLRVNANGNEVWRHEFTEGFDLDPFGILALANGDILCALSCGSPPNSYLRLMRLDSLGGDVWMRNFPSTNTLGVSNIYLLPSGNLLCISMGGIIREFDPDGDVVRMVRDSTALGIAQTADGGFVTVGMTADDHSFILRRYDADWDLMWTRDHWLPDISYVGYVAEDENGDFVLAGTIGNGPFYPYDGLLIRTDCEGSIMDYKACRPPLPDYTLFPNPSAGSATLAIPVEMAHKVHGIQIHDAVGRLVSERAALGATDVALDLSGVRPGIYFLRVVMDGRVVWVTRWVVAD